MGSVFEIAGFDLEALNYQVHEQLYRCALALLVKQRGRCGCNHGAGGQQGASGRIHCFPPRDRVLLVSLRGLQD